MTLLSWMSLFCMIVSIGMFILGSMRLLKASLTVDPLPLGLAFLAAGLLLRL